MKRLLFFIITLTTALTASYANPSEHFAQANQAYADGNYTSAINTYRQLLQEQPSAEIYYNLGNACFKQGELAQAILAYERCLRLKPFYADARHNLRFAESRIQDRIQDTNAFFLKTWFHTVRNLLPCPMWLWISIVLFWLTLILALTFALTSRTWLRKLAFYIGLSALLISGIALANASGLQHRDTIRAEAVIIQGIVNAKASPDRSGTDLFTLHEGTKVYIKECLGDWCCISVGNYVGWIHLNTMERI